MLDVRAARAIVATVGTVADMLRTLRVRELAIVEDLTVEFGPGLNLLTGETGAGKSILVHALGLVAGSRADSTMVRDGAARAVVEAAFETPDAEALRGFLDARGVELDDDGLLVVRREVAASGAGRVFVNGSPGTVSLLRDVCARLLELHGQHEQQGLLSRERHRELLDRFGGHDAERLAVRSACDELQRAVEARQALEAKTAERRERAAALREQIREIDEVAPEPGERDRLERERRRLRHAGEIAERLDRAVDRLYEGERTAAALAAEAARDVARLAELDGSLAELAARIEAARVELDDAGAALVGYRDGADFDPARLDWLESRRAMLDRLCARYGRDEQEVREHRGRAASELGELEALDERIEEARGVVERGARAYAAAGAALAKARRRAAAALSRAVNGQLATLALPRARFAVELTPRPPDETGQVAPGPHGLERVEFLLAANAGETARPLVRAASGGELSRVMLALHVVLEDDEGGRALVFDEVDAGVGGAVADAVGARLAELARARQVLCVTHLPQVAAYADRHFHVHKRVVGGRTLAGIVPLSKQERVDELARMLGGKQAGAASRRNAAELLAGAGATAPRSRARSAPRRRA